MLKQMPIGFTEKQKEYLEKKAERDSNSIAAIIRQLVNKDMKNEKL